MQLLQVFCCSVSLTTQSNLFNAQIRHSTTKFAQIYYVFTAFLHFMKEIVQKFCTKSLCST